MKRSDYGYLFFFFLSGAECEETIWALNVLIASLDYIPRGNRKLGFISRVGSLVLFSFRVQVSLFVSFVFQQHFNFHPKRKTTAKEREREREREWRINAHLFPPTQMSLLHFTFLKLRWRQTQTETEKWGWYECEEASHF